MHAFAPLFLLTMVAIGLSTVAPRSHVDRVILKTEAFERYTGITFIFLAGLILYWLARLLLLQAAFVRLIQG